MFALALADVPCLFLVRFHNRIVGSIIDYQKTGILFELTFSEQIRPFSLSPGVNLLVNL